jgi:hypothetical protein
MTQSTETSAPGPSDTDQRSCSRPPDHPIGRRHWAPPSPNELHHLCRRGPPRRSAAPIYHLRGRTIGTIFRTPVQQTDDRMREVRGALADRIFLPCLRSVPGKNRRLRMRCLWNGMPWRCQLRTGASLVPEPSVPTACLAPRYVMALRHG